MRLSEHFTLAEAMKSQTALRLGIDNTPPSTVLLRLGAVAEYILEPCRRHFGQPIVPSSWYRCPALNRAIGGKESSQHVLGEAVDFEVPGISNVELARYIQDNLPYDQLILEFFDGSPHSGWVHASYSARHLRQAMVFDGENYTAGLPA